MIGAEILDKLELQSEDRAIALGGDLVIIHVAAAVDGTQKILGGGFDPLHGLADLHGDEAHQRLFGIDVELAAKSAAHFGRNHAKAVFSDAQHLRDESAQKVRDLRGGPEREVLFGGAIIGYDAARLHGGGDQALAGDALLDDNLRFGASFFALASFLVLG